MFKVYAIIRNALHFTVIVHFLAMKTLKYKAMKRNIIFTGAYG